jgi:hypothetical protein
MRAALLTLALLLAGCSGGGAGDSSAAVPGEGNELAQAGRLCLVVVDEAIRPIATAQVAVATPAGDQNATTGDDGLACFDVADGTYIIQVSHLLYNPAQTSVEFAADDPAHVVRVQLTRLFLQDPFHEERKVEGYIQCGYSVSGVMSSLCLNDYTHFVGPYTCPQCEHILDKRSADFEVGAGWQTMVYELTWDPTTATSEEMRLTISHFPRPATHWYCGGAGPDPVLVRMEVGVVCEDQQDEPELVPPEGLPNMHLFGATAASDAPASFTFGQSFAVYMNFFYYGKPPEGWSFIAGDEAPF